MSGLRMDPVTDALAALAEGRPVVVVDDEDRENEGDLILAAATASTAQIALAVRHSSGLLCAPMSAERADALELPLMVRRSGDPLRTAYTVSVDAAQGVTTGISAADRARTLRVLAAAETGPTDLIRPGHVLPLRARAGGVLERRGHTEAAVDLMRLAGLPAVGMIVELVHDDGSMRRGPALRDFADEHGLPLISIEQLVRHRRTAEQSAVGRAGTVPVEAGAPGDAPVPSEVPGPGPESRSETETERENESTPLQVTEPVDLPTRFGRFRALAVRDGGAEHLVLARGDLTTAAPVLTRVHSECVTGDVLGSRRCDCGPQLEESLARIESAGRGMLILLRGHEGRGIGLLEKLRAYALQDAGRDTVEANLDLGLPVDARSYAVVPRILDHLQVGAIDLLTHNPDKAAALRAGGVRVASVLDLETHPTGENLAYLTTKRDRLGHHLLDLPDPATALAGPSAATATPATTVATSPAPATTPTTEGSLR